MPTEDDFFTFVYKRQLVWYKRFVLKEPPPWTTDHVLKTYKIINMYRELDKCTMYIVRKLGGISERKKLLLNTIFFRFFNLNYLYEDLNISPFSQLDQELKNKLIRKLTLLKQRRPIFNNAYLISSGGRGVKHVNIMNNLAALNLEKLLKDLDKSTTPEDSLSHLTKIPMIGPFLACEILTDLHYFHWFKQEWTENDFVFIGPGAKWGLEILFGKLSEKELEKKLRHLHKKQEEVLPTIHKTINEKLSWRDIAYRCAVSPYPFLSFINIEGALCEFRKYWRLSQGKGRKKYFIPKMRYRPLGTFAPR